MDLPAATSKIIETVEEEDETLSPSSSDRQRSPTVTVQSENDEDGSNDKDMEQVLQLEINARKTIVDCNVACEEVLGPVKEYLQGMNGELLVGQFCEEIERLLKVLDGVQQHSLQFATHNISLTRDYKAHFEAKSAAKANMADDEVLLKQLKAQIKKHADIIEASQRRQNAYKEEARKILVETNSLQTSVRQGVSLNAVQERRLNELTVAKEQAQEELDSFHGQYNRLREQVTSVAEQIRATDEEGHELEKEAIRVKEQLALKKVEIDEANLAKEKLDQELKALRDVISGKMNDCKQKQEQISRTTEEIGRIENTIKLRRQKLESMIKDQEIITARADKLKEESIVQNKKSSELAHSQANAAKELYMKEADLNKSRVEMKKMNKFREQLQTKIRQLEEQRIAAESERQTLKVQNDALQKQIGDAKRHVEFYRKELEDFNREFNLVASNVERSEEAIAEEKLCETALQKSRYNMQADIQRNVREANAVGAFVADLKHEKDKYVAEANKLQQLYTRMAAELKQKEIDLFEYKKKLMQTEAKLKHQQNLYEAVQSDRSLHSKQLLAAQFEVASMKRQLKTMTYQISAYKEDTASKEEAIKREVVELEKLNAEIKVINEEISSVSSQRELAQTYIRTQVAEENKLNQFVKEAAKERSRQEHALASVRLEYNQLSAQRMKQDSELVQVSNRLKTKRHALLRGERQYCAKLSELGALRQKLRDSKRERFDLESQLGNLSQLQTVKIRLEACLLLEKTRIAALQNESRNKINVHRWRKLESKNPKAFELLQTVHLLQKKLIQKNIQLQEKSQKIRQVEESYLQLRKVLSRQAGPEAIEQVRELEQILKEKIVQNRHMNTELNMYRAQVQEYRQDVKDLDRQLSEITDKYRKQFRQAQKERREQEREQKYKQVLKAKYNESAGNDIVVSSEDDVAVEKNEFTPMPLPV